MKKYAIITPTYIDHFKYIDKYLKSFVKYVQDKNNVVLYFIISRAENNEFKKIIKPYINKCNINILFFEEILARYGVNISSEELLEKYGRFTFQTLKKMYAIYDIKEEKSFVLDSESMWMRKTNMSKLFEEFFKAPKLYGTFIDYNRRKMPLFNQMIANIDLLLGEKSPYWFLENYIWFYEKRILKDLFNEIGTPFELANRLKEMNVNNKSKIYVKNGIFEIILYQNYLYFNKDRYGYTFIDLDKEIAKYLEKNQIEEYHNNFYARYKGGCGLTEHTCMLLNDKNIDGFIKIFKNNDINLFRCDKTDLNSYCLQKRFINATKPHILASSQEHTFGLNVPFEILIAKDDKTYQKYQKHQMQFKEHLSHILKIPRELFSCIFYSIKWNLRRTKLKRKFEKEYGK